MPLPRRPLNRMLLFCTLLLAGCPPASTPDDGGLPDATAADGRSFDGASLPDLCMADLAVPDAAVPDLRMADLRMADLRMADLRMADLHVADLRPADLRLPDMRRVDAGVHGPPMPGNPLAHSITLSHSRLILLGLVQTNWTSAVSLADPSVPPPSVASIGECQQILAGGPAGRGLDAGNLTITGGPNWPLVLAFDAGTRTYAAIENLDDPTDGALFSAEGALNLSAAGGADIRTLSAAGALYGVTPLDMKTPQSLGSWPAADLRLTWVAAPRSDTNMEISLRAPDRQIDCPMTGDPGTYTVKKAVLDALPGGPVYVLVTRVQRVAATTVPDHGPLLLISRSSWEIVTSK